MWTYCNCYRYMNLYYLHLTELLHLYLLYPSFYAPSWNWASHTTYCAIISRPTTFIKFVHWPCETITGLGKCSKLQNDHNWVAKRSHLKCETITICVHNWLKERRTLWDDHKMRFVKRSQEICVQCETITYTMSVWKYDNCDCSIQWIRTADPSKND